MNVKCPISSVLRLAKDGNSIHIHEHGGEVVNNETGKRIRFFEQNGVYYMKIKLNKPPKQPIESPPLFSRRGA